MVQCTADVADYSSVRIYIAEPTSQPPTICITVAKPTFQLGAAQRVLQQNMLRDNYIPCETRRDNYRGTISCGGVINFPTKNGGIITDQRLRI